MSITSGLTPVRRYANGGMSEEEQFKQAMRAQVIAKLEERLNIKIPRGSEEAEDALINSIIGSATDLPISKRGDEFTYGDNDGFSFYINPEEKGAGVRFNKRFAQGGIATYANGGETNSGFLDRISLRKTAEGSGANARDFTDIIFDPTDPVDYFVLGLMAFPPAGIAAKLIQAGVKGNKLRNTLKKVEAAKGLTLGPTRSSITGKAGQMAIRNELADLVTTNNRGIENIGPVELYSDEALAEIREDPSITKKGGIGELVEMGSDIKDIYNAVQDPETREYMIDDMKSGIKNFFSDDIPEDALDQATEDLDVANAEEKELTKKERGINALAAFIENSSSQDEYTGTEGFMIEGSSISTPEITRYMGGGSANSSGGGSSGGGGGMDFMKLLSSFGGKDEENESTQGFNIASAYINTPEIKKGDPEALRDVKEDFDKFKTDVKSNYINFAGGGIANIDPMMMAGGGIAKFADGSGKKGVVKGSIKYLKDKVDKAKDALNKAKKTDTKKKPDTKKKKTKKKETNAFLPPEIAYLGSRGKEILNKIPAMQNPKRLAGRTALYGTIGALGAKALFGGDATETPEDKAKRLAKEAQDKLDAELKERQEAREGLTSVADIHYARSLERAQAAGRSEPTFMDYLASFPGSYMEKVEKDPEFAQQMMAGFAAMGKTTEGYAPRNAFTDFTQGVQEERIRQDEGTPDQLKMMEILAAKPELLDAFKKYSRSVKPLTATELETEMMAVDRQIRKVIYGIKSKVGDKIYRKPVMDGDPLGMPITLPALYQMFLDAGENYEAVLQQVQGDAS